MKKCPYCAEEIEEAAMMCRSCGRALQPRTSAELVGESKPVSRAQSSVWKSASIGAAVITVLAAYAIATRNPNLAEQTGNLLIGLPIIYLVCWIISAGCVWLWREVGAGSFMFLSLVGVFLTGFILLMIRVADTPPAPPPTATRVPAPTLTPLPTETKIAQSTNSLSAEFGCLHWLELRENRVGETICVKGEIHEIARNDTDSAAFRASFRSDVQWTDGTPSRFYFIDEDHDYANLEVGDCIFATGTISINDHGIMFMRIDGNLEGCSG
jgi:hypothetical protein